MSPSTVRAIHIFISSPKEVQPERDAIKRAVARLEKVSFIREDFSFKIYAYEDTVPAKVGEIPQQVVNDYLKPPQECDIFVCILWGRIGSEFTDPNTGTVFPSGTYYEFQQAYTANQEKRSPIILLYRKTEPIPSEKLDSEQYRQVEMFFSNFYDGTWKGLPLSLEDTSDFENIVFQHLIDIIWKNFRIGSDPTVMSEKELQERVLERFQEANSVLRNYPSLIGGRYSIERSEPDQVIRWIDDAKAFEKIAIVVDKPGTGKTVVMARLLTKLEERGTTVVTLKADLVSGRRTENELQEWFHLPISLEDSIRLVASHTQVVVLVDQLDALSLALSQDFPMLDLIYRFILVVAEIPNVRVVISCREFDLNFDPKLSAFNRNAFKRFSLPPLMDEQIQEALASVGMMDFGRISVRMRALLAIPLHLSIYADLVLSDGDQIDEQFYSLNQLYDKLWQRRIDTSSITNISKTIYDLADRMWNTRRLAVPVGVLDDQEYKQAKIYLQTINFIKEQHGSFIFFHQTLFDYAYARHFVAGGNLIGDFILASTQGLLERALMLQVLAYLRHSDPEQYLQELTKLLFSETLRFHLRYLLLEWFAAIDHVSNEERAIGVRLFNDRIDDAIRFLWAAKGNVQWFDKLGESYLATLLDNEAVKRPVIDFLSTIISDRPQPITALLEPYIGSSAEWNRNILFCLSRLTDWSEIHVTDLFCRLMQYERNINLLDMCFRALVASNPDQCCRAIRVYLDFVLQDIQRSRSIDRPSSEEIDNPITASFIHEREIASQFENVLHEYTIKSVVASLAQSTPRVFVDHFLDWLLLVVADYIYPSDSDNNSYARDAVFGFSVHIYHTPFEIGAREDITFVKVMGLALQSLAKDDPTIFREISQKLQSIEAETTQFLLAQGYLANAQEYADMMYPFVKTEK